jgi:hypothetical protein
VSTEEHIFSNIVHILNTVKANAAPADGAA